MPKFVVRKSTKITENPTTYLLLSLVCSGVFSHKYDFFLQNSHVLFDLTWMEEIRVIKACQWKSTLIMTKIFFKSAVCKLYYVFWSLQNETERMRNKGSLMVQLLTYSKLQTAPYMYCNFHKSLEMNEKTCQGGHFRH